MTDVFAEPIADVDESVPTPSNLFPGGMLVQSSTSRVRLPDLAHAETSKREIRVSVKPSEAAFTTLPEEPVFSVSSEYYNYSSRDITVTSRQNLSVTLPRPLALNFQIPEHFVVRRKYVFRDATVAQSILLNQQSATKFLTVTNEEREQILRKVQVEYDQGRLRVYRCLVIVEIDRIVPIRLLERFARIYLFDLDETFQLHTTPIDEPHPFSADAMLQCEVLKILDNRPMTGVFYEIIDPDNVGSYRYLCVGRDVLKIIVTQNEGREPGIYQTHVNHIDIDRVQIFRRHHPVESAESLGLFKTREMAEKNGFLDDSLKLELITARNKLAAYEHEVQVAKAEYERERTTREHQQWVLENERKQALVAADHHKLELQRVNDQLRSEIESRSALEKYLLELRKQRIDAEKLERTDYYDRRASVRKDTSEWLKWSPLILTGLVGLGLGYREITK